MAAGASTVRWRRQRPDPGHLWIHAAPRPWPGPDEHWTDLAAGGLGARRPDGPEIAAPDGALLDDVVYLPPVAAELEERRRGVARECLDLGAPVVYQLRPGEAAPEGTEPLYDLTPALVAGELASIEALPRGAVAVWPLVAGITDGMELWERGMRRLAAAGAVAVRGVALALTPSDRRRLADGGDEATFHRLFHGPPPAEREFARQAARWGLRPFPGRPLPVAPRRRVANRRLAGALALIGEYWLRLARPEGRGQAFYRAARWVDGADHDLAVLWREGNLPVVSWLDAESRQVVEELVATGGSALLEELETEYLDAEYLVS